MIIMHSAASAASSISNNGTTEAAINTTNADAMKSSAMLDFSWPRSDDSSLLPGDDDSGWDHGAKMVMASAHDMEEQDEQEAEI